MTELVSTARRRELGAALRRIREQQGLAGNELAMRLRWTCTMVSRTETGKRVTTEAEVLKYTSMCGLAGPEQDALVSLATEPDNYRLKPHGQIPDALRAMIFHESTASEIESFQPIYMPGILQIEDYTRALFQELGIEDADEIENGVRNRLARRSVLTRPNPAQCTFYVHENVLRTPVGNAQVMHEQMLHLLFASSRPQCSIRVIPRSAGGRGLAGGEFFIFGYPEGSPVVCAQHETTSEFLESRKELAAYRAVLKRVASVALKDAESREFIAWMASDFERQGVPEHDHGAGRSAGLAQEQL